MAMVAQKGIGHVLGQLQVNRWDDTALGRAAVTGPVAATAVRPVTVGGQLMVYIEPNDQTDDQTAGQTRLEAIRRQLSLLPAPATGADVPLLPATGSLALRGLRLIDSVPQVALSRPMLDHLTGPGRIQAEGNALLECLQSSGDQSGWRRPDLRTWGQDAQ